MVWIGTSIVSKRKERLYYIKLAFSFYDCLEKHDIWNILYACTLWFKTEVFGKENDVFVIRNQTIAKPEEDKYDDVQLIIKSCKGIEVS